MKKGFLAAVAIVFAAVGIVWAAAKDTTVPKEKVVKTLEGNSKEAPIVAYVDLTGMEIVDGKVTCPALESTKYSLTTSIEAENLTERISRLAPKYKVTFVMTSKKPKVYDITEVSGLETVLEYQCNMNESAGLGKISNAQVVEQRAANEKLGYGSFTDQELTVQSMANKEAGYGYINNAVAEQQRTANESAGRGEITDAEAEKQRGANETAGLGKITDEEVKTQKAANKKAGLGEITDAEAEKQRGVNENAGFGKITDAEVETQKQKNLAAGNGSVTDTQLAAEKAANKAAGLGDFSNAVLDKQRSANKTAGLGEITDAEVKTQKAANKTAGRGEITDAEVKTQKAANKKAGYGEVTDEQLKDLKNIEKYVAEKKWVHALGSLWNVMLQNPASCQKQLDEWNRIADAIKSGKPGPGEYSDFDLFDGWDSLKNEFEEYWQENCPMNINLVNGPAKTSIDYEKKTYTYNLGDLSVTQSELYKEMSSVVSEGWKKAYRSDWKNKNSNWPLMRYGDDCTNKGEAELFIATKYPEYYSISFIESITEKNIYAEKGEPAEVSGLDAEKGKLVEAGKVEYSQIKVTCGKDDFYYNNKWADLEVSWDNIKFSKNENAFKNIKEEKLKTYAASLDTDMIKIPGKNFKMLKTEVTQGLYEYVMGENPSEFTTAPSGGVAAKLPVEYVSWYDAIYFCNKLSVMKGLKPVYAIDGKTDVDAWGYTPNIGKSFYETVTSDSSANGYRLPTLEEWQYAAKGGKNYTYSGSNTLKEVGWYSSNSDSKTHPVAQKKANAYGLYDMSGNVWEWVWDSYYGSRRSFCGGSYYNSEYSCKVDDRYGDDAYYRNYGIGFRVVCPLK